MHANKREFEEGLIFKDEVYRIIGAAMNVSNTLGYGFLEPIYQECLEIEFSKSRVPSESQKRIQIFYKNKILTKEYIADFLCYDKIADFLCYDKIIVEIKSIKKITDVEEAQLMNYLKATKLPLGLIINFGGKKMEWRRYANTKD